MKRRAALALALLFTTIAGFFMVAYGHQAGFFGGRDGAEDGGPADAVAEQRQPTPTTVPPDPTETVRVIEEYLYEDVAVPAPASGGATAVQPGSGGGTTTGVPINPAPTPTGGTAAPEDQSAAVREEGL